MVFKKYVFVFIVIVTAMWTPIMYWNIKAYSSTCTINNVNLNKVSIFNQANDRTFGTRIGVLIPSTARKIEDFNISSFILMTTSLMSINKTMEIGYNYTIYVGIDVGDPLNAYRKYIEDLYSDTVIVPVNGSTFTKAVNTIAKRAVDDGMDYLVKINDDIEFITQNWTSISIKTLRNFNPSNIGVVGPLCKQGKTTILTTDFVHVTHFNIFGFYYPPQLDNWWVDDWITRVYQPSRSEQIQSWKVVHTRKYGERYHVNHTQQGYLEQLIDVDNQHIILYVLKQLNTSP